MPSVFDSTPKKAKTIMSAFDSESFDADLTIHVDGLVGSATISPSGRDVALASPEGLAIIDLDSPWNPPRRLSSHGLPWLVVDVQWSPFAARDYWVASTANHRCLVWNLNMRDDSPSGAIEHSLQAHSRAITDINFSAHHPDLLASCSVDGYVHHWDLRRPRQPALTYCDWFAGATQVKYSRQDPHVIASAHDRWLHVWDDRKTVEPLKTICAHTSKIYGIDWNRTEASRLVTCSLDKTIKFWDYEKTDEPERVIRTDFPVWRARHTPFGTGLLAMPQNEPGNLYLYDRRTAPEAPSASEPVAVFSGHGNHKVKEFLWRARGSVNSEGIDEREFQLVSWGEDNELRLQKVEPEILESVGYVKGKTVGKNLAFTRTRKGAAYKTFRAVDDTVHRDRRTATMSDPRPGSSGQYRKSALSYGLNSHLRRVGPTWQGSSMKAKVNSGKSMDKSQLQIGWMKGISMTKRKSESDGPERGSIKDSGLFSHGAYDDDWAEPESIQDEFIHVSNRLPNVKWENIDMDALILNASLKGPWGVNDEGIFIKVKVDIPTSYPTSKAPKFYVEKTSFMPEETHEKIERELQILANQFLERKQNCLEVAFSYLLGDVDLENSTTLFKNVRDLNDEEIEALADESSSDEEDSDVQAGGSVSMSQDLTMSNELDPTATLAPTQRPIAVPTPRKCGARFSNDGRLVCFFPSKEQQALALFSLPNSDAYRDRQKGEPNFAGFGRLAQDSPPPRRRYNDDNSGSDDTSDGTEDSESSSSSDSEPSTMHKISLWYQPGGRRLKKTWSANDSLRSSGGGTGAGTGTGTGISRRRLPARPKNTIAIHDLRRLLPSQKQFAQEYAIFGDGADVCMHNAMVAEKYGYHDLVHIWHYAAMLLRNDIPLEIHENRKESVLVIARDASARARDDEYAQHFGWDINLSGRVKWGYHPLAQSLIADLFDYFEKVADIQMLAMLACIFGDSSAEDGVAYAGSHLPQPETPLPMKAPSFSLEYFPTDPALWHINYKSQAGSAITTPRTVHTPAIYSGSPGSEDVIALLEPTPNSFSAGETPPKMPRDHLREVDQTQSLSTSPSNRLFHRSNSAVSAAFSLPKTLAGMVSGSPPDPPSRKRPSPAEAIFNNLTPSVTWGASTVFGGTAPETPGTERTSLSDDETRSHDMTVLVPVAVSVVPENQGLFDDDGWLNTPLLDPSRNHVYSYYRYAYAEMLQMWGQPLSRLEIMKFNVLKGDKTSSSGCYGDGTHSMDGYYDHETAENTAANSASQNPAFGGRKEQLQALIASGRGLDVTGICRIHEEQLDPVEYTRPTKGKYGGAVGTCHRCVKAGNKKEQKQLRCVYCLEPIAALYPPCLSCGCAFHEACLAEWHEMGEEECPAGDDCCCVEDAGNGHVERWSALQAAVAAMNKMRSAASGSLHQQMMDRDKEKSSGNQSGISRRSSIKTVLTGVASVATEGTGSRPRRRSVPTDLAKFMRGGRSDPKAYPQNDDDYDEDDDDLPIIAITSSNGSSDRSRSAHPTNRRAVSTASPSIPPVITTTTTSPHQFGRRRGGSSASHLAATGLGYGSGYGHRSSNLSHFYIAADTDNSGDSADSNNDDTDTAAQSTASNSNRTSQILLSGNDIIDREEWESVASSRGIPSLSNDPLHPSHHSRSGSRSGSGASSRSASGGSDTGGMKDSSTSSLTSRVGGGGGGEGGGSDNSSRRPHHERTPSGNNRGFTALKPPPYGDEPISVARLSLGNRLKKHIASAASASGSGSKGGGDSGSGGNGNIAGSDSGGGETGAAGGGSGGGGNGNGNGSGNGGSGGGSSLLGGGQRPSLLRKKSTGVGVWRAGN